MISESAKKELEKQQYRLVGQHSAVKVCGWTKSMLKGEGGCYKFKFYGIRSHQCMQMTTSISCANRCTFCWRGYKAPVSKGWKWGVDDPLTILEDSLTAHHKLLIGYKGNEKVNPAIYEQSTQVAHVALSLTGEPIMYPRINELVQAFHQRHISTFLVTNAQYPQMIRTLLPITQLYISLDAPNKALLKEIDVPLFDDYYERLCESLDIMAKRVDRTVIRLTCIKDKNMLDFEGYKQHIERGNPDFIEIKGYMWIGASVDRLKKENSPRHEEVKAFGLQLAQYLPEYEYVAEHKPSAVILLAKKKFNKHTWIDYPNFFATYDDLVVQHQEVFGTNDQENNVTPKS
ncbi:MAG: 4-demethylwyosine synthase TYW1 [Candidatus Woesearchaeota archaeon]